MATSEFYIDRNTHKHNIYGLAGTLLIHGLIAAFLFFSVLYPPDPPLEFQGMMMSLGEENMGGPANAPVPDPAPQEQYVPISEQTDDAPLTSEIDESVAIKEKNTPKPKDLKDPQPKIEEPKKPQLELPRKVNQQALFKRKNNNGENQGGYGDGSEPGNEGRPDGSENGNPHGNGLGNSGFGTGETGPDGVSFELSGRKIKQLPNIEDNSKSIGKVVVRIIVNRNGEVIKAVPGQVGSTTTEPSLLTKAKEGSMKTKFSSRDDGPDEQYGTMTFVFKFKP
ncbi:MAG: hypothetical protein SGJ00_03315 [bacterium]|nr:hypothetical protein [bacterium]